MVVRYLIIAKRIKIVVYIMLEPYSELLQNEH